MTKNLTCTGKTCKDCKSYKFTLIELLIVIAIIAVLAGMLLPALGQAKSIVQTAMCKSNQKQIAQASVVYANDNDDYPPWRTADYRGQSWRYVRWRGSLGTYPVNLIKHYNLPHEKMFKCPGITDDSKRSQINNFTSRSPELFHTEIAINACLTMIANDSAAQTGDWDNVTLRGTRMGSIRHPGRIVFFMDASFGNGLRSDGTYQKVFVENAGFIGGGTVPLGASLRHNSFTSLVVTYTDGHADTVTFPHVPKTPYIVGDISIPWNTDAYFGKSDWRVANWNNPGANATMGGLGRFHPKSK